MDVVRPPRPRSWSACVRDDVGHLPVADDDALDGLHCSRAHSLASPVGANLCKLANADLARPELTRGSFDWRSKGVFTHWSRQRPNRERERHRALMTDTNAIQPRAPPADGHVSRGAPRREVARYPKNGYNFFFILFL